jgi:anti-sigma28 factor (negative regulator of flagellin synthesis)
MAEKGTLFPELYGKELDGALTGFMYAEDSSLAKIKDLEDAFDPVNSLIASIKALPATENLTRAYESAIEKAEKRRDDLTAAQMEELEKIDPDILDVLKADRKRVDELKDAADKGLNVVDAEKVITLIAQLPSTDELTLEDAPSVEAARKAFDTLEGGKLTQALVANIDTLYGAEAKLKELSRKSMARLYNPNSGEHFYTADPDEKDNLVGLGWQDEGTGWVAPATSNTPVYRLYNGNAGEHHYTTSAEERDALVEAGWTDEGIGWYSVDNGGVAVYREYNPNELANNHNYTADKTEHDKLVELGWKDEGIAWYGLEEIN